MAFAKGDEKPAAEDKESICGSTTASFQARRTRE